MGYRKQNPLSVNGVLIADANKVTSSTSAVNKAVLTTDATGLPALTALATDGQLIIGSTAGAPAAASLTAGTGITVTPGSNAITIAVSGSSVGQTITGDAGGALSPTLGNWNFDANPSAGSSVSFSGSVSTLTLNTTDATNNTIIGSSAGNATLTASACTGLGFNALHALTNGNSNTAIGYQSLDNVTGGNQNTALGMATGGGLILGVQNVFIGDSAGGNYTGSESSNIIIKNSGTAADANTIRIGTQGSGTGQQNKCFIAGIEGVSVANLNVVTINTSTTQMGSTPITSIVPTGATGTVLQGAGAGVLPVYSTATYPSTTTSQQILYSTAANTVGQLTTANSALAATNSSGTLAMRAFSVVTQSFAAGGTYTPTTGMLYCKVRLIGGGGGGGGAAITTGTQTSVGAGGGAGEYAEGTFSAATIGANQTVTIGAAGAANSGAAGGNGGTTSLGALITCGGGIGGLTVAAGVAVNQPGSLGGSGGSGGSFRSPGGPGLYASGSVSAISLVGGEGGSGQFGAGGVGAAANAAGNAALGYGSGGSGALNFTSQGARSGGTGTAGIIVIDEYVIA